MGEEGKEGDVGEGKRRPISVAEFQAWKSRKECFMKENESAHILTLLGLAMMESLDADISLRRDAAARKRAEDIAAGTTKMNGRELFVHEPWVFDNNLY
ncbi:uncharacterized protein LOC110020780 [Phalaenopsis equestris]|uniref:uncharacterized protein LOC110020780 n=1 Tax=Phalaenopsis equestris TaxID=78828 RepID=UPI0009E4ACBE|nr:uncharacterized protein LOC110020780 [Phalaenopsis equestris]